MASTTQTLFCFFFVLTIGISFTTSLASNHQKRYKAHAPNINVHIINSLPETKPNPTTLNVRCSSKNTESGVRKLERGGEYRWAVGEEALYYCEALWGRFIASWHAFQPKRDSGHRSVFWLVKQRGFFLSWDNSTSWDLKSVWETE